MLSLYTLSSATDASTYYQQGDYYTQEGTQEHSVWWGLGAEKLELKGPVDFKVFQQLLEGHLPNGEMMTQVKRGAYHRPGYDLTFSAPKSLSILALVTGNQALLDIHRKAVQETLTQIENAYAGCRNKYRGEIQIERTGNLVVAAFEHADSRAGDPNLHTHAVLMNMTQNAQGQWRALYADELYLDKLLNGMVYRSNIAHQLMAVGFELEFKENGLFEIKGVPEALLSFFSKRRSQIKAWLQEHQLEGGKAATLANFMTRSAKKPKNLEERQQHWEAEMAALGVSVEQLQALVEEARQRGPVQPPEPGIIAEKAMHSAIQHLTERQSTFSVQELIKTAKRLSLLSCHEGGLWQVIEQKMTDKELIYLENKSFTTPEAQRLTQQNQERVMDGKNCVYKITAPWIAKLSARLCTSDVQARSALVSLLSHNDRQVLFSSNSKTVLTQTLRNYIAISRAQHFYPRVLTQKTNTIEFLKKQLQTEQVSTLEGFLLSCEERLQNRTEPLHALARWDRQLKSNWARDIWIIHGEFSARQFNRLSYYAEALGARMVLTQTRQTAVLESLKAAGLSEVKLISTQQRLEALQSQENLLGLVQHLEKQQAIIEPSLEMPLQQLALAEYFKTLSDNKILVTLSHRERMALNAEIHSTLQQRGVLKGSSQTFNILRPLNFSQEEKSQVQGYQPGDVLRFNRALEGSVITAGSYWIVQKTDLAQGMIELHQGLSQVFWNPQLDKAFLKNVEVFKSETRAIQTQERIVWTRTTRDEDKGLNCIKGQSAVVGHITPDAIQVRLQNGREITLLHQDFKAQHWDYGYAQHLREASIGTAQNVMVVVQDRLLNTKNITLLNDLLAMAHTEHIPCILVSSDIAALKQAIQAGGTPELDSPKEVPFNRAEVLSTYPNLATEPLFNRLQRECLKVSPLHPAPPPLTAVSLELKTACDIVDKICIYHAEHEAVINWETLRKEIIQIGGLLSPIPALEKALDLALEQGWLIEVKTNEQGERCVTTQHTLLMEKACIANMQAGKNQVLPILEANTTEMQSILQHPRLTTGQKSAIELIMTTTDRMVAVQGIAGAGKTTALKEIKRLCEHNHYTLVLANTASAKNQAKSASNMEAKTTAQFLTRLETALNQDIGQAKKDFGGNRLYLLDESSLASTQDLLRLQNVIEQLDVRLALIGDFKQQGSTGAGFAFHDLLAYGIQHAVMQENVRLNDRTAFMAMKAAYAGDMASTLEILKDRIEEIPDKKEALDRIASLYVSLSQNTQEAPLVIIPLNQDRNYVNTQIREALKKNGHLAQTGMEVPVWIAIPKREIEKSDIFSFLSQKKEGCAIRFNTHHPRLAIEAGDYARILEIDLKHQRLTLKIEGKETFYWSPKDLDKPSQIELYRQETRELVPNDIIIFKRNQEAQGIFNGDKATVLKIEKDFMEVLLANGHTKTLNLTQKQNQHLDYGYALTVYAAQGKESPLIIAYGAGPKPRSVKASQLKIGDTVVLPKECASEGSQYSQIVKVVNTEHTPSSIEYQGKALETTQIRLTLKDSSNQLHTISAYQLKVNAKIKNQASVENSHNNRWLCFPPFKDRKSYELPLSTSQQAFLITITRGDNLILVVPYIEDFKKTLEAHKQPKRSALSVTDVTWKKLHEGVKRLMTNIQGKAEKQLSSKDVLSQSAEKVSDKLNTGTLQPIHPSQVSQKSGYSLKTKVTSHPSKMNRTEVMPYQGGPITESLAEKSLKLRQGVQQQKSALVTKQESINLQHPSSIVTLQKGKSLDTLWITEGIKTGLLVASSQPHDKVIASRSIAQFQNITIQTEVKNVVICLNTNLNGSTKEIFTKTIDSFLSQGAKVFIALPERLAGKDKSDFYDLLKEGGIENVRKCLEQKVEIKDVQMLKESKVSLAVDLKQLNLAANNHSRDIASKEYKNVNTIQLDKENVLLVKPGEERER